MSKLESLKLEKFQHNELSEMSKKAIVGGVNTYVVSAPKDGDGTITDAGIEHDPMT